LTPNDSSLAATTLPAERPRRQIDIHRSIPKDVDSGQWVRGLSGPAASTPALLVLRPSPTSAWANATAGGNTVDGGNPELGADRPGDTGHPGAAEADHVGAVLGDRLGRLVDDRVHGSRRVRVDFRGAESASAHPTRSAHRGRRAATCPRWAVTERANVVTTEKRRPIRCATWAAASAMSSTGTLSISCSASLPCSPNPARITAS